MTTDVLQSLRNAVLNIDKHVAKGGWDGPVRVFALVAAQRALLENPELAEELPADVPLGALNDPNVLFSVEQEGLPESATLEELLAQLAWPEAVDGAAIVAERIVVPPSAEADLPKDQNEAYRMLATHPDREDVRMTVGVLRSGESWCAIRTKAHDSDDAVVESDDAIPGLIAALAATFE